MQEPSLFTKILRGDLPGEIIYQDDLSFVILSIEPLNPGHLLVIPKEEIDHIWDLPTDLYQHLFQVSKMMAERLRAAYDYPRIGTIIEGYGVPHAHIHVVGLTQPFEPTIIHHADNKHFASADELKTEADKLRLS